MEAAIDRRIVYPNEILTDTELLNLEREKMVGLAYLAQMVLGTGTYVSGLAVSPTSPASMSVSVAPGAIYALENLDTTAYGSLTADTTTDHQIVKQGIAFDTQTFALTAPTTAGQSIVYLIEAAQQDIDTDSQSVNFYNSANPAQPIVGTYNTRRHSACTVQVKAGIAATTGSQVAPSADAGFVGLYTVTIAYGATTITSGNIALLAGAPYLPYTLPQVDTAVQAAATAPGRLLNVQTFFSSGTYTPTAGTTSVEVECQAAGGSGAGAPATGSTSASCGAGGGNGSWFKVRLTSGFTGGITVTVGAGGVGASGTQGTSGGNSSFGSLVAYGGQYGSPAGPTSSSNNFAAIAGAGGAAPTVSGAIVQAGNTGGATSVVAAMGITFPTTPAGTPGYGVGGGGLSSPPSTAAKTGNNGQPGIVIVREYS